MKEFIKKNFAIILAFVIPIVFIAIIALSTYFPSIFLSTDYNFIYSVCMDGINHFSSRCDNYPQKRYSVVNNKLVVNDMDSTTDSDNDGVPDVNEKYTARLFLHDTEKNESREITITEAQTLNLNSLLTSPDGITVSSYYDRGSDFFFPFDGGSSYDYYLTKGKSRNKLNLINHDDRYYYRDNFQFVGWILPGRN